MYLFCKRQTWFTLVKRNGDLILQKTGSLYKLYIFTACFIHVGAGAWVSAMPCCWGLTRPRQLPMAANAQAQTLFVAIVPNECLSAYLDT